VQPQDNVWVEVSGGIVVARIRGTASEAVVRDCQDRVISLLKDTGLQKVLYDALEAESPTIEVTLLQQRLAEELKDRGVRVSILVPNTRLAYLARLMFNDVEHRVFYNDLTAAIQWLSER